MTGNSASQIIDQNALVKSNISGRNASISLIFLHKDIYEGSITFEITDFGLVCPGMPSHTQTCLNLI